MSRSKEHKQIINKWCPNLNRNPAGQETKINKKSKQRWIDKNKKELKQLELDRFSEVAEDREK